jgi:hypothetical protein
MLQFFLQYCVHKLLNSYFKESFSIMSDRPQFLAAAVILEHSPSHIISCIKCHVWDTLCNNSIYVWQCVKSDCIGKVRRCKIWDFHSGDYEESGMLRHVALVRTDVSEEHNASIIRVTRIGELGTLLVTSNRCTLRRNTKNTNTRNTLYFFIACIGC